ncbi:MAG: Rieske (2Fe-2S) protein, partial [Chloroflexota bacterium]|nr:Rieske (2Fe-2S) protein [Chloroflexota bacterium]
LVYAAEDLRGIPVNADELEPGTAVQAFPNKKSTDASNLVELVRLDVEPSTIVAYSAICTHLGCTVQPNLSEDGYIVCLCHGSVFDPSDNAEVVSGPADRPLPALPIEVGEDGIIVVAGEFIGDVGPE